MRGIDTEVRKSRKRIFKEVANLAYNSTNLTDDKRYRIRLWIRLIRMTEVIFIVNVPLSENV